jgi:hypothetical protein
VAQPQKAHGQPTVPVVVDDGDSCGVEKTKARIRDMRSLAAARKRTGTGEEIVQDIGQLGVAHQKRGQVGDEADCCSLRIEAQDIR